MAKYLREIYLGLNSGFMKNPGKDLPVIRKVSEEVHTVQDTFSIL